MQNIAIILTIIFAIIVYVVILAITKFLVKMNYTCCHFTANLRKIRSVNLEK